MLLSTIPCFRLRPVSCKLIPLTKAEELNAYFGTKVSQCLSFEEDCLSAEQPYCPFPHPCGSDQSIYSHMHCKFWYVTVWGVIASKMYLSSYDVSILYTF